MIYYLDDEYFLCEVFKEYFTNSGFEVETFTQTADLLRRCKESPPDLIFIDFRLSDTTGDKVALQLDPAIPKILVTGELSLPEQAVFLKTFKKPYRLSTIKEFVSSITDHNDQK